MIKKIDSINNTSTNSISTLITLLTNTKLNTLQNLDAKIAVRHSELEQLEKAREILNFQDCQKIVLKPETKTIVVKTYVNAILSTLENEKNGLVVSDIKNKLTTIGCIMDHKKLASYLWLMSKNKKIVKKGKRGSFRYKLAPGYQK